MNGENNWRGEFIAQNETEKIVLVNIFNSLGYGVNAMPKAHGKCHIVISEIPKTIGTSEMEIE